MIKALIGIDDENLVADLTSLLSEIEGFEVRAVATSTGELLDLTSRLEPDLVFVHDQLGVEPVTQTIRDLSVRRPALAILQVSPMRNSDLVIKAMEAGARGVVAYPFAYEDVSSRVLAAREWSIHMSQVLEGAARNSTGRGRVVAVVGAKGGVGTTTMATHLAMDHVEHHPEQKVCLVDVDVEKGDIGAILEVRQSVSIADLAKVSTDLSTTAVADAVIQHESGVHILLAPLDVREAELVTAAALRSIVAMLRREFAVVFIDGGGHVSPSQAAVIEIADETLVVTTSDVLSIRGLRRRMIAWEALGVREEAAFRVIVNKVDKASLFPSSSVPKLTTAQVLQTEIPHSPRVIESAMNQRDPRAITEVAWWRLMSKTREELGLEGAGEVRGRERRDAGQGTGSKGQKQPLRKRTTKTKDEQAKGSIFGRKGRQPERPGAEEPATVGADQASGTRATPTQGTATRQPAPPGPEQAPESRQQLKEAAVSARPAERGAIALENAGIFPAVVLIALIAWQVAVIGFTFVFAGHSTTAAAREYAITGSQHQARVAANDALPGVLRGGVQVSTSGDRISVTLDVPAAAPSFTGLPQQLTTTRSVVSER